LIRVLRLLAVVRRRERLAAALVGLSRYALPAGLLIATGALLAERLLGAALQWGWAAVMPIFLVVAWAYVRPRPWRATARRIDEHYHLHDLLGSALELARVTTSDSRSRALIEILLVDAEAAAANCDPRRIVSFSFVKPRMLDAFAAFALVLAAMVPSVDADERDTSSSTVGAHVSHGSPGHETVDLSLAEPIRQDLRGLQRGEDDIAHMANAVLELLDALEHGTISVDEALANLEALERELANAEQRFETTLEDDPGMLEHGVEALADGLRSEDLTREAARALDEGRGQDAERALSESGQHAQTSEEHTAALERALANADRRLGEVADRKRDTASRLAEAERRLRREQKRNDSEDANDRERRLQQQRDRVDELRRQHEREQNAQRKLDELQRQAAQARDRNDSAEQRRRALDRLGRSAANAASTARTHQRLRHGREAMEEAKRFIRRSGQQGDANDRRKQQAKRFSKAAQGKRGKQGKSTLLVEGQIGDGEPDMMLDDDRPGDGQPGDHQDGQDGGDSSEAAGPSASDTMGTGSQEPFGDEHGIDVRPKNLRVTPHRGHGATRAEIIRTASQEGFAAEAYRDVYQDYRSFAQSTLDQESMPTSARKRVKRYFRMIQPRQ